ncbi:MAG: HAD family hydrolase [Roseburia sp.]|nr:HAD family hydrolase [Roseburia sp.]MCM1099077.1 HAD family hydrolase [Ruminococcus flavefaciens]
MYANYIFDLYGTLVDIHTNETKVSLWKNMSRYMTLQGAAYEAGELQRAYRLSIRKLRTTPETEVDLAPVIRGLYTEKGVSPSEEAIRYWALAFRALSLEYVRLFDGAAELLRELYRQERGVYLLSNAQRLFTEPEMRSLGIYDLFDDVFLSSDIGFLKPSRRFYNALLTKRSLDPRSCVMVGNDWRADAWGAHDNGIASFYLRTPQSPRDEGALPPDCRRLERISDVLSC